jgi:hypothetical protein
VLRTILLTVISIMSKAALILVGLAAALGLGLAVRDADAAPAPLPDEDEPVDEPSPPPEPEEPEGSGSGPSPDPGAGSGAPRIRSTLPGSPRINLIPDEVRNVNLSGEEVYEYQGINSFAPGFDFDTWMIFNSLNEMDIVVYKSVVKPSDWIAMFIKIDPPGSVPDFHYIVYKVSDSPIKDWMLLNLAKVSHL